MESTRFFFHSLALTAALPLYSLFSLFLLLLSTQWRDPHAQLRPRRFRWYVSQEKKRNEGGTRRRRMREGSVMHFASPMLSLLSRLSSPHLPFFLSPTWYLSHRRTCTACTALRKKKKKIVIEAEKDKRCLALLQLTLFFSFARSLSLNLLKKKIQKNPKKQSDDLALAKALQEQEHAFMLLASSAGILGPGRLGYGRVAAAAAAAVVGSVASPCFEAAAPFLKSASSTKTSAA